MPQTVLLTGACAPVARHVAALLAGAEMRVIAADCIAWPLSRGADYVAATRRHPAPDTAPGAFRDWLAETLVSEEIDWVVPSSEEVLHVAHALERLGQPDRLFAPPLALLRKVHDKSRLPGLLTRLGLDAPETHRLVSPDELRACRAAARQLVIKPVFSRFATDVHVRPEPADLSGIRPSSVAPWVAHEALGGDEVCFYAVAHRGRLQLLRAYRPRIRAGIAFTPLVDDRITEFASTFVAATGWHGQVSFDAFLVPDRGLVPIECNPRASSGAMLLTDPALFARAIEEHDRDLGHSLPMHLGLPMLAIGLPAALRQDRPHAWWQAWRAVRCAMRRSAQGAMPGIQAMCLAELGLGALRRGEGLLTGATHGVAWDDSLVRQDAAARAFSGSDRHPGAQTGRSRPGPAADPG